MVEIHAYPGPENLTVLFRDITERLQMQQALRESEERYHRLFEDDLTGDFVSTPEGRILLCNPAFARIFGFSAAIRRPLGHPCWICTSTRETGNRSWRD